MGVKEDFFRLKTACLEAKGSDREKAEQEMDRFLIRYDQKTNRNCRWLLMKILFGFTK